MSDLIKQLTDTVLNGGNIDFTQAVELYLYSSGCSCPSKDQSELEELLPLLAAADKIRRKFRGDKVSLCAIINAKSGLCSEDCIFCPQSARHRANVDSFPLVSAQEILSRAKEAAGNKAHRFGIVISGRGIENEEEIKEICRALTEIKKELSLERCASLGCLTAETAQRLKDAGLMRYHHNLEAGRSFFPSICTTHTFEERVETVSIAKKAGLEVCSGGIFGLGETPRQRLELAFTLRELDVDSVPLNFLHPVSGTPCENMPALTPREILRIIALFRFILPGKEIKVCGGREVNLRRLQPLLFSAGADGILIGNYLTTPGESPQADLEMIDDLGLKI